MNALQTVTTRWPDGQIIGAYTTKWDGDRFHATCHGCGRTHTTYTAGLVAGWFALHHGLDPNAGPATCGLEAAS